MAQENPNVLSVTRTEQYKTVDELFKRSRSTTAYYLLLILSAVIIACGLLLDNAPIVIGGMLVTPVLTPMLMIALGLLVGELTVVKNVTWLMVKSFAIVVAISFVAAVIFGVSDTLHIVQNTFGSAILYFLVAFASGVAATFAWVRKEIAEALPGIAIAVSLVPPLSLVGIQLSVLNIDLVRFYFLVFLFNVVGIILGSFVVFSLLKFSKAEKTVAAKGKEIVAEAQAQAQAKANTNANQK
ncbi:MAG: DUF389 domain-containing protein [Patescibacteria group bacterium]|nr:DUF389 domain-containing protein [Patescibacteria group bacterium]